VDAHVGKSLFHGAIAPLVREGKTVILVTHALHFLSGCDYIYAMDDGRIVEHGTFEQLVSGGGYSRLDILFGGVTQSQPEETKGTSLDHVSKRSGATGQGKLVGRLIVKERRSTGAVKWEGLNPL
jgi:ATP-binding cassette, subfamily C (CFTR/MRP), member 1